MPDTTTTALLAEVRRDGASGAAVRASLEQLLERDVTLGVATAFDLLAGEPRIKPSQFLLIDPGNAARRRWSHRVAAGTALLASPAVVRVFEELRDELAESSELAADVLGEARPHADLDDARRAALLALAG